LLRGQSSNVRWLCCWRDVSSIRRPMAVSAASRMEAVGSAIASSCTRTATSGCLSGKIDVPLQPTLTRARQQLQQVPALGLARPAAVQDDQPGGCLGAGQFKEVLPVARDHDGLGLHRVASDVHVIGSHTKHLRDQQHLMARLPQTPGCFNGHVLVHQESHSSRCAVCAATKGSISR